jgi:hypothetical protein
MALEIAGWLKIQPVLVFAGFCIAERPAAPSNR